MVRLRVTDEEGRERREGERKGEQKSGDPGRYGRDEKQRKGLGRGQGDGDRAGREQYC